MIKHQLQETTATMKRRKYEKELRKLQIELCRLQNWVVHKGLRVIIVFEGRDAAGKGGHDQSDHRACQPARVPRRGITGPFRPRENPTLYPALPQPVDFAKS